MSPFVIERLSTEERLSFSQSIGKIGAIVEDGLDGLQAIRAHLDCAFDWRENDS